LLEITITILGIIFFVGIILKAILQLIEAVLPEIHRIVIKLRELLLEIKRSLEDLGKRKRDREE
jgi:hypothetical protein